MSRPTVFISYSHKDEEEKELLLTQLGVLQSDGQLEIWSDDQIEAGGDWEADINQAMQHAEVGVLLITANFLTSKFILGTEVPKLLQRRRDKGTTVFPIIAKPCAWEAIEWLTKMNVRPKNGTPVWRDGGIHADEELARIAKEIKAILDQKQAGPMPVLQQDDSVEKEAVSAKPAAAQSPKSDMDFSQKMALVTALLACPSISDAGTRKAVLDQLPGEIKDNIARHAAPRTEVLNIVTACLNYAGGLQMLLEIVEIFDGEALPVQKVKALIE